MNEPDAILVTGGAGFIGSHLCEALLGRGYRVLCLDNFSPFYPPETKRRNISACLANPAFTLLEADITESAWENALGEIQPQAVIHLAALAGVRSSIQDPVLCARVNIMGILNLLQFCARRKVAKFLFASSSSVYGNNPHVPFSENDPVDHPISPYAATKKAGELLCYAWHNLHGIDTLCLRFFTVYGPRQRPDLAIHKFAALLSRNEALPVFGEGSSSRDYTYIGDIIAGVLSALDYARKRQCYEIINLGNDRGVTLNAMISALAKISGITPSLDPQPMQSGDVLRTRADISKARIMLDFAPKTGFEEGMRLFWDWFKAENSL